MLSISSASLLTFWFLLSKRALAIDALSPTAGAIQQLEHRPNLKPQVNSNGTGVDKHEERQISKTAFLANSSLGPHPNQLKPSQGLPKVGGELAVGRGHE